MSEKELIDSLEWLREDIVGRNILFKTPFGEKPLVYADYTASGRALHSLENYILKILQYYANTHTEDDFTGKIMTGLLHKSEHVIKKSLNAPKNYKIIFYDAGTTGGLTRLLQILGVFIPPASKKFLDRLINILEHDNAGIYNKFIEIYKMNRPVIFVGPYEHHSNEIMWRQSFCDVIEIPLGKDGYFDLQKLEEIISSEEYKNRRKIGSFSAASNVTGILSPVYDIAKILHKHNAIACFDFAACAPYVEIDMNKDNESYFDAVFLSPHKFLGGPGTSGILVFNDELYDSSLPPTISGGGTVDYVSSTDIKYTDDVETREKPGTPAIIQDIKISFLFSLKNKIGIENIEKIEKYYLTEFYRYFEKNEKIIFYGPTNPRKKVAIIPFNIKHQDKILHPRFVTKLLNDLFGIQTRAGCSCAGPYGHILLGIDEKISHYYRCAIGVDNLNAIKPGWVRLNLHYSISEEEFRFILKSIDFVIEHGFKFLDLYEVDFITGDWKNLKETEFNPIKLEIEEVYKEKEVQRNDNFQNEEELYEKVLTDAERLAKSMKSELIYKKCHPSIEKLIFFYYTKSKNDFMPKEEISDEN